MKLLHIFFIPNVIIVDKFLPFLLFLRVYPSFFLFPFLHKKCNFLYFFTIFCKTMKEFFLRNAFLKWTLDINFTWQRAIFQFCLLWMIFQGCSNNGFFVWFQEFFLHQWNFFLSINVDLRSVFIACTLNRVLHEYTNVQKYSIYGSLKKI